MTVLNLLFYILHLKKIYFFDYLLNPTLQQLPLSDKTLQFIPDL